MGQVYLSPVFLWQICETATTLPSCFYQAGKTKLPRRFECVREKEREMYYAVRSFWHQPHEEIAVDKLVVQPCESVFQKLTPKALQKIATCLPTAFELSVNSIFHQSSWWQQMKFWNSVYQQTTILTATFRLYSSRSFIMSLEKLRHYSLRLTA